MTFRLAIISILIICCHSSQQDIVDQTPGMGYFTGGMVQLSHPGQSDSEIILQMGSNNSGFLWMKKPIVPASTRGDFDCEIEIKKNMASRFTVAVADRLSFCDRYWKDGTVWCGLWCNSIHGINVQVSLIKGRIKIQYSGDKVINGKCKKNAVKLYVYAAGETTITDVSSLKSFSRIRISSDDGEIINFRMFDSNMTVLAELQAKAPYIANLILQDVAHLGIGLEHNLGSLRQMVISSIKDNNDYESSERAGYAIKIKSSRFLEDQSNTSYQTFYCPANMMVEKNTCKKNDRITCANEVKADPEKGCECSFPNFGYLCGDTSLISDSPVPTNLWRFTKDNVFNKEGNQIYDSKGEFHLKVKANLYHVNDETSTGLGILGSEYVENAKEEHFSFTTFSEDRKLSQVTNVVETFTIAVIVKLAEGVTPRIFLSRVSNAISSIASVTDHKGDSSLSVFFNRQGQLALSYFHNNEESNIVREYSCHVTDFKKDWNLIKAQFNLVTSELALYLNSNECFLEQKDIRLLLLHLRSFSIGGRGADLLAFGCTALYNTVVDKTTTWGSCGFLEPDSVWTGWTSDHYKFDWLGRDVDWVHVGEGKLDKFNVPGSYLLKNDAVYSRDPIPFRQWEMNFSFKLGLGSECAMMIVVGDPSSFSADGVYYSHKILPNIVDSESFKGLVITLNPLNSAARVVINLKLDQLDYHFDSECNANIFTMDSIVVTAVEDFLKISVLAFENRKSNCANIPLPGLNSKLMAGKLGFQPHWAISYLDTTCWNVNLLSFTFDNVKGTGNSGSPTSTPFGSTSYQTPGQLTSGKDDSNFTPGRQLQTTGQISSQSVNENYFPSQGTKMVPKSQPTTQSTIFASSSDMPYSYKLKNRLKVSKIKIQRPKLGLRRKRETAEEFFQVSADNWVEAEMNDTSSAVYQEVKKVFLNTILLIYHSAGFAVSEEDIEITALNPLLMDIAATYNATVGTNKPMDSNKIKSLVSNIVSRLEANGTFDGIFSEPSVVVYEVTIVTGNVGDVAGSDIVRISVIASVSTLGVAAVVSLGVHAIYRYVKKRRQVQKFN